VSTSVVCWVSVMGPLLIKASSLSKKAGYTCHRVVRKHARFMDAMTVTEENHTRSKGELGHADISLSRLRGTRRASNNKRFAGFLSTLPDEPLTRMLRSMFGGDGACKKDSPMSGEMSPDNLDGVGAWPDERGSS
jgi:hypothetical protein